MREHDEDRFLTAVNFAPRTVPLTLAGRARVVLSTDPGRTNTDVELGDISLRGNEGVLFRLGA